MHGGMGTGDRVHGRQHGAPMGADAPGKGHASHTRSDRRGQTTPDTEGPCGRGGATAQGPAWPTSPIAAAGHVPASCEGGRLPQPRRAVPDTRWRAPGGPPGGAKAVGDGYCRLQVPLKPAVARHRLGALEGGRGREVLQWL